MDDLLTQVWEQLEAQWVNARRFTSLWTPAVALPAWSAPAVALTSLLALVVVSGVALLSLGMLLTTLLIAYLLLENVFGISVSLAPRG